MCAKTALIPPAKFATGWAFPAPKRLVIRVVYVWFLPEKCADPENLVFTSLSRLTTFASQSNVPTCGLLTGSLRRGYVGNVHDITASFFWRFGDELAQRYFASENRTTSIQIAASAAQSSGLVGIKKIRRAFSQSICGAD